MTHGEILKRAIEGSGMLVSVIAERTGYSRGMIYVFYKQEVIAWHKLHLFGEVISYDFRKDIPDMPERVTQFQGQSITDLREQIVVCHRELEESNQRYITLLEEYKDLAKQLINNVTQKSADTYLTHKSE
jgi:hypothetical protein